MTYRNLREGFKIFREDYYKSKKKTLYKPLIEAGQHPEVLIIACSDSRIHPSILTQSDPGVFFSIRNIAALVPPYHQDDELHGVSAAIEFAVKCLKVEHIIVLGHENCGGIAALIKNTGTSFSEENELEFLDHWLDIGSSAKKSVYKHMEDDTHEKRVSALEQAAILTSINNLLSFPWIKDRWEDKKIHIHGWYFKMSEGRLLEYNPEHAEFLDIEEISYKAPSSVSSPDIDSFLQNYSNSCSCTE